MTFFLLLAFHLFAAFLFQSSFFSEKRKKEGKILLLHCLIYFFIICLAFLLIFDFKHIFIAIFIISFFYMLALYIKNKIELKFHKPRALLFIFIFHQVLNITTLFAIYHYFKLSEHLNTFYGCCQEYEYFNTLVIYFLLFTLLSEPAATLTKKVLALISNKRFERSNIFELKAGAMIGKLERMIVAILVLNNQYGAIGLVMTAKSIARFKQMENKNFAEKYLVGTLTSLFIALIISMILKKYI